MNLMIHEIIDSASKKRTKAEKIQVLQENNSPALRDILRGTYDQKIRWNLPAGKPPYRPAPAHAAPSNLLRENKKFGYFVVGGPDMMKAKRERIFIEILEGVHPLDAELVISMINKEPINGISRAVIDEAFPGLCTPEQN